MSLLVICEMLGAIVNTLTVDDKYPFQNCENLPLSIQMQLYHEKNLSAFCSISGIYIKLYSFWKKDNRHS